MEVYIQDIVSTIRTTSGDSALSPKTLEKIVTAVLRAVEEQQAHRSRVEAERRVTGGVRDEQQDEVR